MVVRSGRLWAGTCIVLAAVIRAVPAAQAPAASVDTVTPSTPDSDRRAAADLFRRALALDDPSQEKIDLLRDAAARDPSYFAALQAAQQAVLDKKQADAKAREEERRASEQSAAARAASTQAQDRLDTALALRRSGSLAESRLAAEQASSLARSGDNTELADQAMRLISVIDADVAWRRRLWQGLLAAGIAGLALAVVLLKKRTRRLEMVEGPEPGRVFKLSKDVTTIGAVDGEVDIVIADESRNVSRRHCQVARSGRHFFLVDYSRNGTFLNGRALPKNKPVLLRTNDEITLCDSSVILIYR